MDADKTPKEKARQELHKNATSYIEQSDIGLVVRVFANGPGDLGSIPGRVIPKTQKMVLDASLLNTQHYKVRIKGKVEQSREGVAPSPTPWCSSYRKGSLRVTLEYGRQLYFTYIEQILEATSHETEAVKPLTSHHRNYPSKTNKTCGVLLKKQGRTHEWLLMDPFTWTCASVG